ncbi:MAG: nuclear transport factor 2 family protein [Calditrichaeota bacterium]|nr:MAG: nuclear transport factor 2 family protein [Calditrichota bacterium]
MEPFDMINTAMKFNEKINRQDINGLAELMSENHKFIDSEGTAVSGKSTMVQGWKDFMSKHPDYRNQFTSVTLQNDIIVMVGYSTCSIPALQGANLWTARIQDHLVDEWRVYWLDKR